MYSNKPMVAFGRYPCCNAVRPLPISERKYIPVHESCPACGSPVTRVFNGSLHVISVGEVQGLYRHEPCPAFHTRHGEAWVGSHSANVAPHVKA